MELTNLASKIPFAHLLGVKRSVRSEDDEEVKKSKHAEEEPDAEDDDKDPDAQEDENNPDAENEDDDQEASEEEPDAEDDPEEEEDDKEPSAKKAKLAERKRCKAIFNCSAAGVRPDMAAHLAFNTGLSAKTAIGMLKQAAAVQPKKSGLQARMSEQNLPKIGSDVPSAKVMSTADKMVATYNQLKSK